MEKEKASGKKKKYLPGEIWLKYLIANIMCLGPVVLSFFCVDVDAWIFRLDKTILSMIWNVWQGSLVCLLIAMIPFWFSILIFAGILFGLVLVDGFYWVFQLHYVHIVLELGIMIYAGYMLRKTKDKKMFKHLLIATIASIFLNLVWAHYGWVLMDV